MKKLSTIILLAVAALSVVAAVAFNISYNKKSSPQYPVIKFASDTIDMFVDAPESDLLEGVTATDPEDGDVTKSIVIEGVSGMLEGTSVKVTYAAIDSRNHVTKAERTVNYIDYTSPRFSMSRPMLFRNAKEVNFMSYITATDVLEGDISGRIKYSLVNSASIDGADEYEIKLSVTNKIGDTVTIPLTVGISDEYANSGMITLSDYLVYTEKGMPFDPNAYVVSYTTSGGKEVNSSKGLDINNNVNTDEPGVYTVEYSDSKTASRTRLVVVVE